ncbi:hypothetical protein A0H81_06564 [Grifola frondosa]|uniref:Uncharacterized protein n=1 Tax=Grifola frondosa TaxID=5627 RepID=A0A1C7M9T3_GRIFR|nr:hypothetical protein A0H81_06564 [Grifola frondosa]
MLVILAAFTTLTMLACGRDEYSPLVSCLAREQSIVQCREKEEESSSSDEEDVRGASVIENANIDPQLRNEGHVVGKGRLRAETRRAPAPAAGTRRALPVPGRAPRRARGCA